MRPSQHAFPCGTVRDELSAGWKIGAERIVSKASERRCWAHPENAARVGSGGRRKGKPAADAKTRPIYVVGNGSIRFVGR